MRRTLFSLAAGLVAGALGPAADLSSARAAPPPAFDRTLLPASTLVLRATPGAGARDGGLYAVVLDAGGETRWLVRLAPDGTVERLARAPRAECLAVDDERVYWVGDDGVQAVARTGGDVETLAGRDASLVEGNPDPSPWAIALDGDDVYFSLDGGIGRVPKHGGPAQLLAGGAGAMLVGVDAAEVFWLEPRRGARGGSFVATPKRGGPARRIEADLPEVLAVVLEDDAIDWLGATPGTAAIHRTSKEGGRDEVLVGDVPTYYARGGRVLAAGGGALYWLDYPQGLHGPMRVRGRRGSDGAVVTLAEAFPPANKLLVDDRRIYWAQEGVRAIERP